jgi:L-threonylcarbamoyladenylate synthase
MTVSAGDPGSFETLVQVLVSGGVAIAPGDTMYGLVGAAPGSEDRIRRVKGRGEDKPFLQILPDDTWVARVSDMAVPSRLARYWPGPLTMVFAARAGGTVALRVPDSEFLLRLLRAVNTPLFSTSVNRAGQPPLLTLDAMRREFESDVDLVYDAGPLPAGLPSTLLDITSRPFRVLRQGALRLSPDDLA